MGARSWTRVAAALATTATAAAMTVATTSCQWLAGFTLTAADADGGSGAAQSPCDVLPAKKIAPGGAMVLVKRQASLTAGPCYWIDEVEVSVREYAGALARDAGAWSAECAFKIGDGGSAPSDPAADPNDECAKTVAPTELNPFDPDKPIRCVDWCDAQALCFANGKRLCQGNPQFSSAPLDRKRGDEWGNACSPSQDTIFPWGDQLDPGRCNVDQPSTGCTGSGESRNSCGPLATTAFTACHADGGARELIGNVAEWTASCAGLPDGAVVPATDLCEWRGGSYLSVADRAQCATRSFSTRSHRDPQTGFRCCADLTADELAQLPP